MLERLRIQEVSEIIFTVPEGAIIADTGLKVGEPVMIIKNPGTSKLLFSTSAKKNEDRGFISTSGQTKSLDFTINEGSILYSVWSYLHGTTNTKTATTLKHTEWLNLNDDNLLKLSERPVSLMLYKKVDGELKKLFYQRDYMVNADNNTITLTEAEDVEYFAIYSYEVAEATVTKVKQIHNNIFCTMDIYFQAVDMDTDEKHGVCIHCDKVQITTDLAIGVNNSGKASFTPIEVRSITQSSGSEDFNKTVATITVV